MGGNQVGSYRSLCGTAFAALIACGSTEAQTLTPTPTASPAIVEEGVLFFPRGREELEALRMAYPELVVDHPARDSVEIYGPAGLARRLMAAGYQTLPLESNKAAFADYPSPEQIDAKLLALTAKYPRFVQLSVIGKSWEGRNLTVLKLSNDANTDQKRPEFKYISSMHGDEITGRELLVLLMDDLLSSYGTDARVTRLLDTTELYIMPSMNPDGSARRQRGNAHNIDLNRSFPDFISSPLNRVEGREPEVQAIMKFQAERHFSLSANFHGGAEVVNYPWDTTAARFWADKHVTELSLEYAKAVPYIRNSREFTNGITNGNVWYEVDRGMQDWSTYYYGDLQVTIELSRQKWPTRYTEISRFYRENREALLRYMEQVKLGIHHYFDGRPGLSGQAKVRQLEGSSPVADHTVFFFDSEYHESLPVGRYEVNFKFKDGTLETSEFAVQDR